MYVEGLSDRPKITGRVLVEGKDYAKGTPLDSFIPGDTMMCWQDFYQLTHDVFRTAKDRQELKLAEMLYRAVGNRMGNPLAGDLNKIMRHHKARVSLLARTQSKFRDVIVSMLRVGYDVCTIAAVTGVHPSTVRRWRRWLAHSESRWPH
ncbi:hypothetical protein HB779_06210 [Phyllobacterium sp. 628]|uniref:helix-turn-helix domain-containing protein n=1 Tax=Phyllobacterium sp. 628 TaxID=2718938 RepID=UPI0016624ED2|nr:helix-turn-helix domain-containing protein [Phyllobacterium sp. 628]QND51539.1 hypothetical protein HB779_06210 [Phyllobacterium sp. 628]